LEENYAVSIIYFIHISNFLAKITLTLALTLFSIYFYLSILFFYKNNTLFPSLVKVISKSNITGYGLMRREKLE